MLPRVPGDSRAFFRFQVTKTADPRDVYQRALTYLQADYFQQPGDFGDVLTAVLPPQSDLAARLIRDGRCVLAFEQFSQHYRLPCAVFETEAGEALREVTLWHNRAFNPSLPDDVLVLGFRPDWKSAETSSRASGRSRASSRISGNPCSVAPGDGWARSGTAPEARAPACRGPADCP